MSNFSTPLPVDSEEVPQHRLVYQYKVLSKFSSPSHDLFICIYGCYNCGYKIALKDIKGMSPEYILWAEMCPAEWVWNTEKLHWEKLHEPAWMTENRKLVELGFETQGNLNQEDEKEPEKDPLAAARSRFAPQLEEVVTNNEFFSVEQLAENWQEDANSILHQLETDQMFAIEYKNTFLMPSFQFYVHKNNCIQIVYGLKKILVALRARGFSDGISRWNFFQQEYQGSGQSVIKILRGGYMGKYDTLKLNGIDDVIKTLLLLVEVYGEQGSE